MVSSKLIKNRLLIYCIACFILSGMFCSCNSGSSGSGASSDNQDKVKFVVHTVIDQQLGGMPALRMAIPQSWKAKGGLVWDFNACYLPVHGGLRAEAPDGESWVEFYGTEMFWWADPAHDRGPYGAQDRSGAIHQPNISLPQAMARYIIARNRGKMGNLQILGYRPVNNLSEAFAHSFAGGTPRGKGICMRVRYELNGNPVDEEFYGLMPPTDAIPAPPAAMEYHSCLYLAHSIGAKSGKLDSLRPLLGTIATSYEIIPGWQQEFNRIQQALLNNASQQLEQGWANIELAKQISAQAHASNEAFLQRIDASLAQSRSQQHTTRPATNDEGGEEANRANDGFDQYVRGTEHMKDKYGVVSDQYTDYNYHWTDGFGRYAHSNDPNYDPNKDLNGNYQQMTPQN
jgi:hypothetical protein